MKKLLTLTVCCLLCGFYSKAASQTEEETVAAVIEVAEEQPEAPAFTLKNIDGQDVSLSDFQGKWVVLDFWGSWCIWCIRGIPEMKEVYAELSPKVEFIGVDCGDTVEAWKKAVSTYELPWVNVYAPEGSPVIPAYQIQGFPTKIIINPEGKIYDYVIGEDPAFYESLRNAVK